MKTLLTAFSFFAVLISVNTQAFAIKSTVVIDPKVIAFQYHSQSGDPYIDLLKSLSSMGYNLSGADLLSVKLTADTNENSGSEIFLALNARIEGSVLIAKRDNEGLRDFLLTPLDRAPVKSAQIIFRGRSRVAKIEVSFESGQSVLK